ncbi:uncharacterized protein LOC128302362 isoform X2 [Anopheles moucheti]|uniref:uncharacterized protein LOC128302362 isoform X2 n=1 Tax=Anopheles moucheti TaxID=186751 RepID=UPI0022F100B6|nr:uncharacterized protein LOC128302362 isoform X2 [Anopheles moucheti]
MKPKISLQLVEKKLHKLSAIQEISIQLEETRKFLSHFFILLEDDAQYEDGYFQTLSLCEYLFSRCDHTDRDIIVVTKILNTILEIINRGYVSTQVVVLSLATIHTIMGHLHLSEVVKLREMLRMKLPIVNQYFRQMNNFSIMSSIVGFIYTYVYKYDPTDREAMLQEVLNDFDDVTGKLTEMLLWPLQSFNSKCRDFLNNIPDRKYFSLSARFATFGGRTIVPRRGYDCISFEWNSQPHELSFGTFCFEGESDKVSEVSIDYKDISTLDIFSDCKEPRVVCEYGKITATGVSMGESYQLKIACLDNAELHELAIFIKPFINSICNTNLSHVEPSIDEVVIRHDKLYNTVDLNVSSHSLVYDNSQMVRTPPIPRDSTSPQALHSMGMNENNCEENISFQERDTNFKPFDMQWKDKLLSSSAKNKRPMYDPYDIAHMREEEREQRRQKGFGPVAKRGRVKKGASVASSQRTQLTHCSTPEKQCNPKVVDIPLPIDQDELSPIDENSEQVDSDGSDATYVPYTMLSKTASHGRGNQKGTVRQSKASARVLRKKSNMKKNVENKGDSGTGKRPAAKGRKAQQSGAWSQSTKQMDVTGYDVSGRSMDTTLSKPQTRGRSNTGKTNFLCERLNAKKTTTQTTTKVTTTKTTEGIGACTDVDNNPSTEIATLEDVNMTLPPETVPVHATQKVTTHTSLYKVEKHQEYRVQRGVNQLDCCIVTDALTEGDRAHILAHVNKIIEILAHASNNAGAH